MTYENITLRKQNVTMVNGYFYMFENDQSALIVKTDDGTQAYSYPLDTTIDNEVVSMEYDGQNFWTLENPGGNTIIIKRWNFENYVLKQRDNFTMLPSDQHKYNSTAMTVEHYHLRIQADAFAPSAQVLQMYQPKTKYANFNLIDKLNGRTLSLGPNAAGKREDVVVNSVTISYDGVDETIYNVNLNSAITNDYLGPTATGIAGEPYRSRYGDPASFYTDIWVFNNWAGVSNTEGALYRISSATGSYIAPYYPGGEYQGVAACTFFDVPNYIFERAWQNPPGHPDDRPAYNWPKFNSICYVRTTNLIFLNPDDFSESYGSMTIDNLDEDQATVIPIFDLTMEGVNIYRLQDEATYYGTTYPFAGGYYSYQLSTLEPFVTSISLRANPAILPANKTNTSEITAIVKDQFNLPIGGKAVYLTDDDVEGEILAPNPANTDQDGVAITSYLAGNVAREVKITATVQQGGVETPTD